MSAIVTVTFNPAIDKSTSVAALAPEKKLRCRAPVYEPGGGGVNVARAVHILGGDVTAVYLAGGYSGLFYTSLLQKEEVPLRVIETEGYTRENLIVVDEASGAQYRFGMPGPAVWQAEWEQCLQVVEKMDDMRYLVASGSLCEGIPVDIFARLGAICKKKNVRFIADTSGEALQKAAFEGVFLLKPNLGELSSLAGRHELKGEQVEAAARDIISKGECEAVVVSMGPGGALLVTADEAHAIATPAVKRKSTVGAGDCMVAGIVLQLAAGKGLLEAAQYGVACGTAATMNPGTALCKVEDVEWLFEAIKRR